jgi:putative resolvase
MTPLDYYFCVCYHHSMKLSDYAKKIGIRYETAWRWFRDGKIKGYRIGEHTIIVTEGQNDDHPTNQSRLVAIYARVSSAENLSSLDSQADRMVAYCTAKGYQVHKVVKEVGSGINESRPKLLALLEDLSITLIVVEHKDRLVRFGYRYLETLLHGQGRQIEAVNQTENGTEDFQTDLTSIIYSFCSRLYGQQRARHKMERIVAEIEANGKDDEYATG